MILLGIILYLTVLEAVHEGITLNRRIMVDLDFKWIPGIIEAFKLAGIVALIPSIQYMVTRGWQIESYAEYALGWVFVRYTIFDPIHNLSAGLPIFHFGETKIYDRIFKQIDGMWGNFFHYFTRFVTLVTGLLLVLKSDGSFAAMDIVTYIVAGLLVIIFCVSFFGMIIGMIIRFFNGNKN
jgi:hypothetical protein